jgi:hypothetical protein
VQSWLSGINTAPAPQSLLYKFTGSTLGAAGTLTEQTWVNSDNVTQFGTAGDLANTGSLAPGSSATLSFSGTVPYSSTEQIHLVLGSTTGATSISGDNNDQITPASVPAPAGILLLLSGTPLLSFGYWLRRRQGFRASVA